MARQLAYPACRPDRRMLAPLLVLLFAMTVAGCHTRADPPTLVADARAYFAKGENRAAVIQLKNALQQQPNNGVARALLGQVYLDAGDGLSAEKELRKALSLGVPPQNILPQLGQALLLLGQFDQLLREIVPPAAAPADADLLVLRASAQFGLGQLVPARDVFQQVLTHHPNHPAALLGMARLALVAGQSGEAQRWLEQALKAKQDDTAALRFQGDLASLNGQPDAAMRAYRQIVLRHPENTRAYLDIANLHIQAQRLAEASATLAAARKSAPGSLLVLHMQALLDFRAGRPKPALDALQQVLRAAPDFMPALLLTAAVQLALGSYPQADDALQRFLAVYPHNLYAHKLQAQLALRLGQPEQAIKALAPFLAADSEADVELLTLAGQAHMAAHAYDQAATYFSRASALAPQSAALHAALGASQLGLGVHGRAIAELERATSLDATGLQPGSLLVHAHLQAGQPERALAAVNALLRRRPADPAVLNLKGEVLLAAQQNDAARAAFEHARQLAPTALPALDNLARLDLQQHQPAAAERRYRTALDQAPDNAAIMTALARLAETVGQPGQAIAWLERAANIAPTAPGPLIVLASAYGKHGQRAKGLALARTLRATHPQNLDVLALLALLEYDSGDLPAALDHYGQLAAVQPDSAAVQIRLAMVYQRLGRVQDGLAAGRKALALAPKSIEARVIDVTLLIDDQQYDAALASARALQQQVPTLSAGNKLEGDIWLAQGRGRAAVAPYERALALAPGAPVLIRLHQALRLAGDDKLAEQRLANWLTAHPDDDPVRLYVAANALLAKQYGAAIAQLEQVVRRQPRHVIALNDLAWAYRQSGDPRALQTARRALALEPANPALLDTLGCIELDRGELERALPRLRQAATLAPGNADIQLHLGQALARSGDKRAARRQLEHLLASAQNLPNRAEVVALLARL